MGNPYMESAFVAEQMEVWLDWFRNNHVDSYIDIIEKFIRLHPYYIPNGDDIGNRYRELSWNDYYGMRTLRDKLSDKGYESLDGESCFRLYSRIKICIGHEYSEINGLVGLFSRHSLWFERVYIFTLGRSIMVQRGIN